MGNKILIAIDGTGPWSNTEYASEMSKSFVSQIHQGSRIGMKFYHRGPSLSGVESGYYGLRVLMDYIAGLRATKKSQPIEIYLTGYSRGAMIAVYVANRIALYNDVNGIATKGTNAVKRGFGYDTEDPAPIVIKKMLLFDAVDSDATMFGPGISKIPAIVERVDHFVCHESSTWLPRSRWYFERIELKYSSENTKRESHSYGCTHSAISGLPGQGDHRTPTDSRGVLDAGIVGVVTTGPRGVMNPEYAVVSGATKAVAVVWDAVKSNVTLDQDFDIYRRVLEDVNRCLDGFECNPLPAYDKTPGAARAALLRAKAASR
jgi:hypothetical protein